MPVKLPPEFEIVLRNPLAYREQVHAEIAKKRMELIPTFADDPLGFVMFAWPWGKKGGPLEGEPGPDENQREFLSSLGEEVRARGFNGADPVMPVRMAATSGHGTGKSALGAWIAWWIASTRPDSIGTVTAGTFTQLESRTWAAIRHWGHMCITAHWFDIQASGIYSIKRPDTWKIIPQTCRKENAQSFAGQHARKSTSWYMLDEASEVPDEIWKTAYGGLTDGEPMFFAWGQMVRSSGEFYRITFGASSNQWNRRTIDSRNSRFTNKTLIDEWIEEYGEDSDYIRVRVRGLPPRASELQFIGQGLVDGARERVHVVDESTPLIVGYDAANGGSAFHSFWFRRGFDAKTIPPVRLPGDTPRDVVVAKAVEILSNKDPGRKVTAMFGDQAFGSVILERCRNLGYTNVFEVNFGGQSPDVKQANLRAYMWNAMKEWLALGAIPDEEKYAQQLMGPGYGINSAGKLVLESKEHMAKRGVASPDDGDALALTFAQPIAPFIKEKVFKVELVNILSNPFTIPRDWLKGVGVFCGPRATGAVWVAREPGQSGKYFVYDEYSRSGVDLEVHAAAIRSRGDVPVMLDCALPQDLPQFLSAYRKTGLNVHSAAGEVEPLTSQIEAALGTGSLKIFKSVMETKKELSAWQEEYSLMSRSSPTGKIERVDDYVVLGAMRALWFQRTRMSGPVRAVAPAVRVGGSMGWAR